MAEVINLNRARKAKLRDAAQGKAAENRIAFGRTGAEREAAATKADKASRDLDGKKRE